MTIAREVRTHDGTIVEYVSDTGHHYLDGQAWRTEPLTPDEQAMVTAQAWAEANPPPPPLDTRVEAVEAQVADLDAIIVAVLS